MKKKIMIYFLGLLVILVVISLKFDAGAVAGDEVPEQSNVAASWNALSAGSFIFN